MHRVRRQSFITIFFLGLLGFINVSIDNFHYKIIPNGVLLISYLTQDLILNLDILQSDMIIHHLLSIYAGFYLMTAHDIMNRREDVNTVLATEISTLFFALRGIGYRSYLNDACFFITFFYFRIWKLQNLIFQKNVPFFVYPLYLLNVYWFLKIIKKLWHRAKKN